MKQFQHTNLTDLSNEDYANLFNVYKDNDDNYFYNINKGINIIGQEDIIPSYYRKYTVEYKDTYPLISHKVYDTFKLWWLICKVNNINNPIDIPEEGTILYILTPEVMSNILSQIKTF